MNLKTLVGVLLLYIYINNPIFNALGFGLIKVVILIALLYNFVSKNKVWKTFNSVFSKELKLFFFIVFIIVLRTIFQGDSDYLRTAVIAIFEIFFIPCFFIAFLDSGSDGWGKNNLVNCLVFTGFVGAFISALCISNPAFNSYIKFGLMKSDPNEFLYRGFGMAEDLNGTYGIVQIILLVILLFMKKDKSLIDWLFVPLIFISAIFNARTSFFILAMGLLSFGFFSFKKIYIFILVIILSVLPNILAFAFSFLNVSQETLDWVSLFFENLNDLNATRDSDSNMMTRALLDEMIVWPQSLGQWIFGTGIDIFRHGPKNSDIGFIRQLNYGGLIYLISIISFIWYCTKRLWNNNYRAFSFFFLLTFIVCNYKGQFVIDTGGFRLMMLIYFYLIMNNYRVKNG